MQAPCVLGPKHVGHPRLLSHERWQEVGAEVGHLELKLAPIWDGSIAKESHQAGILCFLVETFQNIRLSRLLKM